MNCEPPKCFFRKRSERVWTAAFAVEGRLIHSTVDVSGEEGARDREDDDENGDRPLSLPELAGDTDQEVDGERLQRWSSPGGSRGPALPE